MLSFRADIRVHNEAIISGGLDVSTCLSREQRCLAGSLKDSGLAPAASMDVRTAATVAQQNVVNSSPAVVGTGQYPGE